LTVLSAKLMLASPAFACERDFPKLPVTCITTGSTTQCF
jgi:hypothetical protein